MAIIRCLCLDYVFSVSRNSTDNGRNPHGIYAYFCHIARNEEISIQNSEISKYTVELMIEMKQIDG